MVVVPPGLRSIGAAEKGDIVMSKVKFAAGALCLAVMAGPAPAAVVFDFYERNGNVEGEFGGTLIVQYRLGADSPKPLPYIYPFEARVGNGDGNQSLFRYRATSPGPFGPDLGLDYFTLGSVSNRGGDVLNVAGDSVLVSEFYKSGESLSGWLNFMGTTYETLGVTPGSYVWTLDDDFGDTVTVNFISRPSVSVVPLPATLPLLLGALGFVWAAARRRGAPPAHG